MRAHQWLWWSDREGRGRIGAGGEGGNLGWKWVDLSTVAYILYKVLPFLSGLLGARPIATWSLYNLDLARAKLFAFLYNSTINNIDSLGVSTPTFKL